MNMLARRKATRAALIAAREFIASYPGPGRLIDQVDEALELVTFLDRARDRMSERQAQVCDLLLLGMTNKEIARKIGLSPRTVEVHRIALYAKFGAASGIELVNSLI